MPGYLVEMLLKGLYLPEIYRRFSAIQQNTIFIESIARCGKGNTQQNLRQNVEPNIHQTLKKNNNKRKFKGLASHCKAKTTFTFHFSIINA